MTVIQLQREKARRKHLRRLRQAGWRPHAPHADIVADGTRVYVCDVDSGALFVAALAEQGMAHALVNNTMPYEEVCNAFGGLIADLASGKIVMDDAIDRAFSCAAALYIGGTRAWRSVRERSEHACLLVLRYFDHSQNCHILRPTTLVHVGEISPQALEHYVQLVLDTDRHNHPARFAGASVVPFQLKQTNRSQNGIS